METPPSAKLVEGAADERLPKARIFRSLLLAIAAAWFLILALSPIDADPAISLIPLVQRLAIGYALVAVALIDWSAFRGPFGTE